MNQQSEHLSNAQIEDYGIRTSGAGLEEEQEVEKHLAECPSCRGRVLEFQRKKLGLAGTQLQLLRSTRPKLPGEETGKRDSVAEFADLPGEMERSGPNPRTNSGANSNDPPGCPSPEELRQAAAGLSAEPLRARIAEHAATCEHCGPTFKSYTEIFSDDLNPEELAMLEELESASPAWQLETAQKMLRIAAATAAPKENAGGASEKAGATDEKASLLNEKASNANESAGEAMAAEESARPKGAGGGSVASRLPAKSQRRAFPWKWALTPAMAAACALIAFSVWYPRDTPEKVERLLAQASTEQRTLEARWPGAEWAEYSVSRGKAFSTKSLSLREATKILNDKSQAQDAKNVKWMRAMAEDQIAIGKPEDAIRLLERARQSGAASAPLSLDMAMAYFVQGEQTGDPENYKKSRDQLDDVLRQQPTNTVALFNRALVDERLDDSEKAKEDWRKFLLTERDPAWKTEAQTHLKNLQDR